MSDYIALDNSNFDEVLSSNDVVLVDFWANWCGPCKMVGPFVEEIATEYLGKAAVGKVDVDANPELCERYGIMTIPAIFLFKNGEVKDKHIGFRSKAQLEEALNKLL